MKKGGLYRCVKVYRNKSLKEKKSPHYKMGTYKLEVLALHFTLFDTWKQSCGSGIIESGSGIIESGSRISSESGSRSNPDSRFWWPKAQEKKIAIYFCPSCKIGFQPSKENIQHFKKLNLLTFFYVCGSLLPFRIRIRIRIANPDTDPQTPLNPDPIRIRIRIRIHNTV